MTEIITMQAANLPDNIEDLSKFVLIGNDKLQAVRAEISAIKKLGLAKEVHQQKLKEAQELSEIVTLAKIRMGELLKELPKAKENQYTKMPIDTPVEKQTPKSQVIKEIGLNQKQAERLQQMADNQEIVQAAITKARENGDIVSQSQILKDIKDAKKQEKAQERTARKSYTLDKELPLNVCKLFCADIRDGLPQIPDNSVDFIITDPPYSKEYLPLYEDLSKLAARVLKNGGSLVCMGGQSYLPEVIRLLQTALNYHWCMCYLTPGGQSPQLFQKKVNTFWKPLLWFVKGTYDGDWAGDVLKSPVNDNDKEFHEWGQSFHGMKSIIERLTNPADVILDPFLGGGTTAIAAITTGRYFIGADINSECLTVTSNRATEAYKNVGSEERADVLAG